MNSLITSIHNVSIRELIQLKEKSRARKKLGLFLIEGVREISIALQSDYQLEKVFYYPKLFSKEKVDKLFHNNLLNCTFIEISKEVYQKIAYREKTEGLLAIAKTKTFTLDKVKFKSNNPLILVAEAPEKPGNIGALLRTADAANLDLVIIANPKTDLYNPNIIRSSIGCVFTNQIAIGSTSEIIDFLKENSINCYGAALTASKSYFKIDFTKPSAIIVGTEATGLTKEWLNASTQNIIIPMQGTIDSMNVSVAAAIVVFEAKRQRGFK